MASLIQAARNAGTGTSITVTLGQPTTAGQCLVVLVYTAASTNGAVSGVTLGGSPGNFAAEASKGTGGDHAIVTCWSNPSCAGGQTAIDISTSGSSGTQTILAWAFEMYGMLAAGPLLDQQATLSSAGFVGSWALGPTAVTSQASEAWFAIAGGNVAGGTPGTYTGPASPWVNQPQQGVAGGSFSGGAVCGYQAVSAAAAASYNGTVTPNSTIEGLLVTLKAAPLATALNLNQDQALYGPSAEPPLGAVFLREAS